jgi:tRNA uridine 5-carboxymethylaminomethyl modification enzyme
MKYGYKYGLIPEELFHNVNEKERQVEYLITYLEKKTISPTKVNDYLKSIGEQELPQHEKLSQLVKRSHTKIKLLLDCNNDMKDEYLNQIARNDDVLDQVEIEMRYAGYIRSEMELIEQFNKNESITIPENFDYKNIKTLSTEGRERLSKVKPINIGQASRISGVTPADVTTLLVFLK